MLSEMIAAGDVEGCTLALMKPCRMWVYQLGDDGCYGMLWEAVDRYISSGLPADGDSLIRYCRTCVVRACIDLRRLEKRRRGVRVDVDVGREDPGSYSDVLEHLEASWDNDLALLHAVVLGIWRGDKRREIVESLRDARGCSLVWAYSLYNNCIKRLKELL